MSPISSNIVPSSAHILTDALSPAETQSAHDADAPAAMPASPEPRSTTPNSLASFVPTGGLHPVTPKPQTELFGFILDKMREAMSKKTPEQPPEECSWAKNKCV